MKRVAVFGLGAMGRRMALRLRAAQYDVVVWSRSSAPDELKDMERAASPRAAATGADVVLAMVTDDEASRAVWTDASTGALQGLAKEAIAIESSTLTPAWIAELASVARAHGVGFLDAPVLGSRPQADAGALIHLVGGDAVVLERARPILAAIGGAVHHLGPSPAGAIAKLAANVLFGAQVALLGELLAFVGSSALERSRFVEVMSQLPVASPAAIAAARSMLGDAFPPMFPIALVAKDLGYAVSSAARAGADVPITRTVHDVFAAARDLDEENITAIAKKYR